MEFWSLHPDFLANQLDCIFTDIYPDAVKIGMVSASNDHVEVIAQKLKQNHAKNIVVDPVMVATSGSRLIAEDAVEALKQNLLPIATVPGPPNIPEAEVLSGTFYFRFGGYGSSSKTDQRKVWLCGFMQGRTQYQRCRRSSLGERQRPVVLWKTNQQSEHPWHRMHPLQCDCFEPCKRNDTGTLGAAGKGISVRSTCSNARSWKRSGPDEPSVRTERGVCR